MILDTAQVITPTLKVISPSTKEAITHNFENDLSHYKSDLDN